MHRLFIALVSLVCLSGCISILPEPKVPLALYRLGPIDESSHIIFERTIIVRQPEAPRILSGVEMVAREGQGAIRVIKDVAWADRAPRLLQMALLDYLGTDGGGAAVLPEAGVRAEFELSWRIAEFSMDGQTANARAELTVLNAKTRAPIKQLTVTSQSQARGSDAASRAEALVDAGQDIVRQAAQFVADVTKAQN